MQGMPSSSSSCFPLLPTSNWLHQSWQQEPRIGLLVYQLVRGAPPRSPPPTRHDPALYHSTQWCTPLLFYRIQQSDLLPSWSREFLAGLGFLGCKTHFYLTYSFQLSQNWCLRFYRSISSSILETTLYIPQHFSFHVHIFSLGCMYSCTFFPRMFALAYNLPYNIHDWKVTFFFSSW